MISIIVPIYKVEEYLERCINSILNQTYTDYELILVDDGSPDNCGKICDKLAKEDVRIKVIHKENGGLSDARNAGLKVCSGEFVAFIDSDDWIAPDFLEKLLYVQKNTDCDIVECGIIRTSDYVMSKENNGMLEYTEYRTEDALKELITDGVFHQYVWNKLYKREVIGEIFFENGKTNEDEFWTYQVFGNAQKVMKINNPLYYYFQRNTSIMGSGYSLKRLHAIEAKELRQRYIEQKYNSLKDVASSNLFFSCLYAGQMSMKYLNVEERKQSICYLKSVIKDNHNIKIGIPCEQIKDKFWFIIGKLNFEKACIIRNILNIGI